MSASTHRTNFSDQSVSSLQLFNLTPALQAQPHQLPLPQMAQSNPKPTSHADRAAVTSDCVTRAAKRALSLATAAPLAVVPELPPVADAPTTEAPASVAITSPSVPAVPVSMAVAAPSPVPTLVPVSAAVVPPGIAKPAAPTSKATTSSAAKANAVTAARPAATALPATKTTATAAAPAMALAPQPATTSPPASAATQNAAQPSAASVPTTPSNDVIAPTASSTPRGRPHARPPPRTSIADRFNTPRASLLIGTPGLAENNGPDPIAWLIAGISADQAQTLIDMGCLCSDHITIFFHEYHPPISGFMGTWQGFTMAESDAELAHQIIVDAVLTDPAITPLCTCPPQLLFGNHIITLPINLLSPRGPFVAWNVYIKSPTNDEEAFNTLHGLFQRLIIDTPFHGQGRIYTRPLHCNICLSIDHPTNLCLLPSIPGWLGPTPETIGALLDATCEVLNPRAKKSGGRTTRTRARGKGKDRDDRKGDRKGGDRRRGN
ncbi:hypothetical protein B0H14DRAFT_3496627 [Mycena olivaceomarginata]|nr:hypothetical protein B0H14DRAFT_3496627 [Mycena olivaceomarginata]